MYLNTLHPLVSPARAADLLRGTDAAFIAVRDLGKLEAARRAEDAPMYLLLEQKGGGTNRTRIVSNRPVLRP